MKTRLLQIGLSNNFWIDSNIYNIFFIYKIEIYFLIITNKMIFYIMIYEYEL